MKPDQQAFAKAFTRMMRISSRLFLVCWLMTCAMIAVLAACALLGVADRAPFSGRPTLWAGVLLGSIGFAGLGLLFMRFWRRTLDRFSAHVPGAIAGEGGPEEPGRGVDAHRRAGGGRMSPATHIALQMGLTAIGGLAGMVVFVAYLWDATDSEMGSLLLFACVVVFSAAVPQLIMFLVPARCPKCCGSAYGRGRQPIVFVCRGCGHRHDTGISVGSEDFPA